MPRQYEYSQQTVLCVQQSYVRNYNNDPLCESGDTNASNAKLLVIVRKNSNDCFPKKDTHTKCLPVYEEVISKGPFSDLLNGCDI